MQHVKRLLRPPSQSFFLLGPRGTGKTTWIKNQYKHAVWIDLLLPQEVNFYAARPERLIHTARDRLIGGFSGTQIRKFMIESTV